MIAIFIEFPWLALLPAVVFGMAGVPTRRTPIWIASAAWFLYAAYETAVSRRILCSGECNIRVDLLLFYPVLFVLSLIASIALFRKRRGPG